MWLTAMIPEARPPHCSSHSTENCKSATTAQMAILLSCFALISIGGGGISCSLAFGADQLNKKTEPNKNQRVLESFISWYIASQAVAVVFSLTGIIYIQDHLGWKVGFGVPAALMLLSTLLFFLVSPRYVKQKPHSSMFTGFVQVIVVAYKNRKLPYPPKENSAGMYHHKKDSTLVAPSDKLRLSAIFSLLQMLVIHSLTHSFQYTFYNWLKFMRSHYFENETHQIGYETHVI